MIEGIAGAFDRAEARRRREVALYWIEAVASAPTGDFARPLGQVNVMRRYQTPKGVQPLLER